MILTSPTSIVQRLIPGRRNPFMVVFYGEHSPRDIDLMTSNFVETFILHGFVSIHDTCH